MSFIAYRRFPTFWTTGEQPSLSDAEIVARDEGGPGRYRVEEVKEWAFGGMSGTHNVFVKILKIS